MTCSLGLVTVLITMIHIKSEMYRIYYHIHLTDTNTKKILKGAGEVAQWVGACPDVALGPSLVPNTHTRSHSCL